MAPLPAPAEKPSHRVSDSQSHAKLRPPAQVAVFCAAPWPNLQPALSHVSSALILRYFKGLRQVRPGLRSNVGIGGCVPPQPKKPRYPNRVAGFLFSAPVVPSFYRKHTASGVKPRRDTSSRRLAPGVRISRPAGNRSATPWTPEGREGNRPAKAAGHAARTCRRCFAIVGLRGGMSAPADDHPADGRARIVRAAGNELIGISLAPSPAPST